MLVNVVDVPPLCNFILPAIVRTGPLAIAISTAGASPALAKRIKAQIAETYGEPYARLAVLLNEVRGWAKGTLPTYQDRKAFFEGIVNGEPDPIELLRAGDEAAVRELIAAAQRAHSPPRVRFLTRSGLSGPIDGALGTAPMRRVALIQPSPPSPRAGGGQDRGSQRAKILATPLALFVARHPAGRAGPRRSRSGHVHRRGDRRGTGRRAVLHRRGRLQRPGRAELPYLGRLQAVAAGYPPRAADAHVR